MFIRLLAAASFAFASLGATASSHPDNLPERYADAMRCMERAIGKHWDQKYRIQTTTNQWGATEPTGKAIASAPQIVRVSDLSCRYQVGLDDEARP